MTIKFDYTRVEALDIAIAVLANTALPDDTDKQEAIAVLDNMRVQLSKAKTATGAKPETLALAAQAVEVIRNAQGGITPKEVASRLSDKKNGMLTTQKVTSVLRAAGVQVTSTVEKGKTYWSLA